MDSSLNEFHGLLLRSPAEWLDMTDDLGTGIHGILWLALMESDRIRLLFRSLKTGQSQIQRQNNCLSSHWSLVLIVVPVRAPFPK